MAAMVCFCCQTLQIKLRRWRYSLMAKKLMTLGEILLHFAALGYRDRVTGHGFRGLASIILDEAILNCNSLI
jgi:hypothetical protein